MSEHDEKVVIVRPDIRDFQLQFGNLIRQMDRSAEALSFVLGSSARASLREELEESAVDFEETNRKHEEYMKTTLVGRDMSHYGPISSDAAEVVFEASREDLQLPNDYPEGTYLMTWKPKFKTGFVTGSNPLDVATWRFELSYEPASYRHPIVSVQWETDWSDWNMFKSPVAQNYPVQVITQEIDKREGGPWQLAEPEVLVVNMMNRFVQRGKLREIRSYGDAVAEAIKGTTQAVVDSVIGEEPGDVLQRLITEYNSKKL